MEIKIFRLLNMKGERNWTGGTIFAGRQVLILQRKKEEEEDDRERGIYRKEAEYPNEI